MMQDMLEIAAVHHCSVIQHHDTVCHARNGVQIMRNEDHGCVVIFFNMQKFIQNLILGDGINGRGRFVCYQKSRFHGRCNADHNALEHTAGKLMRIFFQHFLRVSDTIMIACPMAIKYHEYASIDVIAAKTHGTGRHILNLISDAVILIVCLFGIPQARTYFRVGTKSLSTSLQINLGIFYVVPLVIFILTAVYVVLDAINEVNLIRKGDKAQ